MTPPTPPEARRITPDCQPVFPCRLWLEKLQNWYHCTDEFHWKWNFPGATYWHPAQLTVPTQPPAPLAGGTEAQPSAVPLGGRTNGLLAEMAEYYSQLEDAAGCKEGRPVSPVSNLGGDDNAQSSVSRTTRAPSENPPIPSEPASGAKVSPATGEREAELRPTPRAEIMDCIRDVHATQWHGMTYEEMLADGAETIRRYFTEMHAGLIQENARAHESYEGLNAAYQQLAEEHAKTLPLLDRREGELSQPWRLSSVCREKEAEIARLTEQEAEEQHKTSYALGYKDGWRDGRLPLNNPTIQ